MRESTGATTEAYEQMADTTDMAQKRMTNAFDNLKVAVGDQLKPQMDQLYETGENILSWATEFVNRNEALVPLITALTIGIGALTGAAAAYAAVTTVLIPLIHSFTMALAANPVLAVATAIMTLVLAMGAFATKGSEASQAAKEYAGKINELTQSIHENTEAYREQREEISNNAQQNKDLAKQLTELMEKEKKSAAEKETILLLVDKLNEAVPDLGLSYNKASDAINMTTDELNGMLDAQEEMEQYKNSAESWVEAYQKQQEASKALEEAEQKLAETKEKLSNVHANELHEVFAAADARRDYRKQIALQEEAIENLKMEIEESSGTMVTMRDEMNLYSIQTADLLPVHQQEVDALMQNAEALKGNQDDADSVKTHVGSVMEQMQELQDAYQEIYESAYAKITNQIGLFEEMSMESGESITDLIGNMKTQVEYMNEYAENIKLAMEYGVDKGIIEKLSDGSEKSAQYLAAIVADGGQNIDALNEEFARVKEGKEEFATTVAEMQTDYAKKMDELVTEAEKAVQEMAMYDKSFVSAVQTCKGLIDGVDSMWNEVISKHIALARAAREAYNKEMDIKSPSRKFKWSAEMEMEGIKAGISNKEDEVLRTYRELANTSIQAYTAETVSLKGKAEDAYGISITSIPSEKEPPRQVLSGIEWYMGKILELMPDKGMEPGGQVVNIYQPVKSPVEMARALKKMRRELAF